MVRAMAASDRSVRLYVEQPLGAAQSVVPTQEQAHYLFSVMRLGPGDGLRLFNGADGEWRAEVMEAHRRGGLLRCTEQSRPQTLPPDLWLLFAPLRKARTDFVVEKAAEMGVRRILPVQTEHTNAERIRRERLQAHAIEAAEQCGGVFVPEVAELARLDRTLESWPAGRRLMVCDETRAGEGRGLHDAPAGPWAVLIGPEGGFSPGERARFEKMQQAQIVSLGPRILRADTAAVAALTVWQMALGDWK